MGMERLAVVTGGIGGLGTEICRKLAASGRRVVAADLDSHPARVEAFRAALQEFNGKVAFEALNVADFERCAEFAARVSERYGPVDILVNAAGITRDASFRKMGSQQWMDVMRVNLDSVFNITRQFIDGMCERGFGRIVNISSVNGQTGQFGQTNSVSPGYCRTQMVMQGPEAVRNEIISKIPVGRLGEPHEIARVVEFLSAEDAGYITGANVPVNGGYFMAS